MKNSAVVALVTAAALAAVPSAASAAPGQDLVAGSGKGLLPAGFGPMPTQVHVNAVGNPLEAKGQVPTRIDAGAFGQVEIRASVECVHAVGNQALVLARTERSNTPFAPVGSLFWRKVVDNGEGANDAPDLTGAMVALTPTCPSPLTIPMPTGAVDQGNFVVHDGG